MTRACLLVILSIGSLCLSDSVAAEDGKFRFELAPYAGYRIGGSFDEQDGSGRIELNDSSVVGLVFNIEANPKGQYELLYSRQSTDADTVGFLVNDPTIDMDVEHFQFGGTYLFDGDNTRPFIALTIGLTQFDPALAGTGSESFFSASFGGGLQLNANKRLGVRLEARVFTTFIDDDSNIFCSSGGNGGSCLFLIDAATLSQWEARAGLVFRF